VQTERVVDNDNTVAIGDRHWQLEKSRFRNSLAGCTVTIHEHLDERVSIRFGPHVVGRYTAAGQMCSTSPKRQQTQSVGIALAEPATVKLTGWFACDKCTSARVAKGDIRPSNPVCAKECIEKGDDAVFLSEQGKRSLKVRNYTSLTEDLGFHIEVKGRIDPAGNTIEIESVKRLWYDGASCVRPRSAVKK
jgi:hypothetical protein